MPFLLFLRTNRVRTVNTSHERHDGYEIPTNHQVVDDTKVHHRQHHNNGKMKRCNCILTVDWCMLVVHFALSHQGTLWRTDYTWSLVKWSETIKMYEGIYVPHTFSIETWGNFPLAKFFKGNQILIALFNAPLRNKNNNKKSEERHISRDWRRIRFLPPPQRGTPFSIEVLQLSVLTTNNIPSVPF